MDAMVGRTSDGTYLEVLIQAISSAVGAITVADYSAARVPSHDSGTGTATVTVPAGAWVSGFSFAAGASSATLIITPLGGAALPTITIAAGGAYSRSLSDMGNMVGWTFAFDSASEYIVEYYIPEA